ncbi:MAG: hypothetical protein ACTSVI_03870 [Promethearchaeota archaeon]
MNPKNYIKKLIFTSGDKGIRLDVLLDKVNREFPNKVITDVFILDVINKDKDIETSFIPSSTRMIYVFKGRK